MAKPPHRKTVKHFDLPGHAHELTFSCYKRRQLLCDEQRCEIVASAITAAADRHNFMLVAFVLMPEHVHLLVFPKDNGCKVKDLLFAVKRPSSYRIKQTLVESLSPLMSHLTVQERPGRKSFRFWQEGGGYDRNLTSHEAIRASIRYIHENPVRRGLCKRPEQWRWSSQRQWSEPDAAVPKGVPLIERLKLS